MLPRRSTLLKTGGGVGPISGELELRPTIPLLGLARRSAIVDICLAPFVGFVVGTVGTASGSVPRGLIGAAIWIPAGFPPIFYFLRRNLKDVAEGRPERFKPPRWLRQRGVGWAVKVGHRQFRKPGQSPKLLAYWSASGYLYPTGTTFEFVLDRLERTQMDGHLGMAPYDWSIPFDRIQSIDYAIPTGTGFVRAKTRYPSVRFTLTDASIEWFGAEEFIAQELAPILSSFLPRRPPIEN